MPEALTGAISVALRLHGPAAPETLSPQATEFYDRGLYLLRKDGQSFDQAIPQFEQAARIDPRSPLPLTGLVEAETMKFEGGAVDGALEDAQRYLKAGGEPEP